MDPKKIESIIWEGRARISWGDPPDEVEDWLRKEGLDQQQIDDLIRVSLKERTAEIRKRGVAEFFIGSALVVLGAAILLGMFACGIAIKGVFVVCGIAIVYGLYRISRGWNWLFVSGNIRGPISEMEGDGLS